jgi:hypothetical protein
VASPVPPTPVAEPEPPRFAAYAGGLATVGLSPAPTGGGKLGLGLRFGALGVYVEGRIDAPVSVSVASGSVRTSLFMGSALPCIEWHGFSGCMSIGVGALQVEGDLAFGRRATSTVVKTGLRLGYQWLPLRHLGLFVHLDVGGVPTRVTVYANETPVWSTAPVSGELALGIVTES